MGIEGPDGLEGYVVVSHAAKDGHDTEVHVVDAVAGTPRAADAILATLGAYRSLALEVRWHGGAHDTLTQRLRDRRHAVTLTDFWMLRLVDVPRALALRGYNPFVKAAVTFVVRDEVVSENEGAWRVAVEDGRVEVTKCEGDGVALDVRALATLYTGFRTAEALAADGLAAGDVRDLAAATALFAGATPALAEHF